MAYLVSQYPTLSMIFIIREVLQLRSMGFDIGPMSVNAPDRGRDNMTADELGEAERTYYLKPQGLRGALRAHWHQLREHPGGYLKAWAQVFRLAGGDLRALFYNAMYMAEALIAIDWMTANGYRHVHAHLGSQAATVGLFIKTVTGWGLSITVHGPDEFYDAYRQYLPQKIEAADFVVCISHFARSQLMKLSPHAHWSKFVVSRLGVDPQVFQPPPPKAAGGVFEVLCVGRLTPAKGQHLLVDAVGRLAREGAPIRLRLVGSGVDGPSLQRQVAALGVESTVIFEGGVNQDRIRSLYAQADAFCLPSFAEGIPVALMEAMSMEIPVLSTGITGIPELIDSGKTGLLVPPSDTDALVAALRRLIDDRDAAREMGRRAREKVCRDYDLERNVAGLADIFRQRVGTGL